MVGDGGTPALASGAMYTSVPIPTAVRVAAVESQILAMPKSAIFGVPGVVDESMRMLAGLMSPCTTPAACTAPMPAAILAPR